MQYAPTNQKRKKGVMYCNYGRGTMHRAHRRQKAIKQEGHNSLCPYRKIEKKAYVIRPYKR